MKKIRQILCIGISLLMLLMSVSALEITKDAANDENGAIVTIYSGYNSESEGTLLVYDVSGKDNPDINVNLVDSTTPIIAIDQKAADGSFTFKAPSAFTGKAVMIIGGEGETPLRALLNIENGKIAAITIPDEITADFDAENAERVLEGGKFISIAQGVLLKNAKIDATDGYVMYGPTKLTGKLIFNDKGQLDVSAGNFAKLENGTNTGFLHKYTLKGTETKYTINLVASGTYNGKDINSAAAVDFDFGGKSYKGNTLFKIIVQNVPNGISVDMAK